MPRYPGEEFGPDPGSALASGDAALEPGADAFLLKPVDPLQFVSTVRDLLGPAPT